MTISIRPGVKLSPGVTVVYENRNMQGKIAVVLMYNRVLTEQEHLVNYAHYKARFGLT